MRSVAVARPEIPEVHQVDEARAVVVRHPDGAGEVVEESHRAESATSETPGGSVAGGDAVKAEPQGPKGLVWLNALPVASEVYIDEALVGRGPVAGFEVPVGTHRVVIVGDRGRTKRFDITVQEGKELHKVWDFKRGIFGK